MTTSSLVGRVLALVGLVAAVAVVAVVLLGGGTDYRVKARFVNASQLVKGNLVHVAGASVGTVEEIDLTPDGQAEVTLAISDGDYAPLRRGTKATIRQASLSGVANRYVDLSMPPGPSRGENPDGGTIPASQTTAAVELDELINTLDPKTRASLRGVIRGYRNAYAGAGQEANAGWSFLNPSLAASARLFRELNYDEPKLRRFVRRTAALVSDLAQRRDNLAGLVDHLATTTAAIARERGELGESIQSLPGFMRRANTTFVNLRATLDDLDPLVEESRPVARKLRPFLGELRPFARDARPTLRDLSQTLRRRGADNDLVELTRLQPPVRDIAIGPVRRNGKQREGAFPASVKALGEGAPELATLRPYAPELTGWFDDFSHSGLYDALGGASRAAPYVNLFSNVNGVLRPILDRLAATEAMKVGTKTDQTWRCPGALERGAMWKPTPDFPCDESQGPLGR